MRPQIVKIIGFVLFLVNSVLSFAQTPSAGSNPPPPPQRTPPEAPIDTYIYLLLFVAIIYGAYAIQKLRKASKVQ